MLSEVIGEEEFSSSLNISGREGSLVVVSDEFRRLKGQLLEHVNNQRVDNFHSLLRNSNVVGDGLEDLVDVKGERFEVLLSLSSNNLFSH